MKKKVIHKVYEYTSVFEPDEENGGFTVTIPALPGCISEGDTFEEALINIQEAASLYIESIKEDGHILPNNENGIVIAPIKVIV